MHAITRINELWPYLWLYQPSTATILLFPSFIPHASISPSLLLSSFFSSRDCFRIETNATITWSFRWWWTKQNCSILEKRKISLGPFDFITIFSFPNVDIVSKSILIKVIEEFWGSTRNTIFIYMISILFPMKFYYECFSRNNWSYVDRKEDAYLLLLHLSTWSTKMRDGRILRVLILRLGCRKRDWKKRDAYLLLLNLLTWSTKTREYWEYWR